MRIIYQRASVAALLFLCSAFNSQVRAAESEVAVVVKIGGIPWFSAMEQGIKRAGKEDQVNAYMVGPTTADPAQQVRAVEDLIAKKVSVIAVVPNDAKALEPVFDRAKVAGIPIITHESPDQKGNVWDIEMINNKEFGEQHMKEGFNVPAADVGIIVASSTSVRQRIQSLGRVLRKHRGVGGEEKTSVIHVLYARDTVDDAIYARTNWEEFTGAERNLYFIWETGNDPVEQSGPPRSPLPVDVDVDASQLAPGDSYEGQYEGAEFTSDTQGNIRDVEGRFVSNPGSLPAAVKAVKGTAGRFRITPTRRYVLVRVPEGEDWTTRFVTQLREAFVLVDPNAMRGLMDLSEHSFWVEKAAPGDEYPFPTGEPRMKLNYRQRRGGVIAKRIRNGEEYARVGTDATDQVRGEDARRLLEACRKLSARQLLGSQFEVNDRNDAICRTGGRTLFISALKQGLEFPEHQP